MKMSKIVLWKAIDGREFSIDTEELGITTPEELYEHIAELRKKNGYPDPTFIHAAGPGYSAGDLGAVDVDDVFEGPEKDDVLEAVKKASTKLNPDKFN